MYRLDGLEVFKELRGDALAITGVGYGGRELHDLDPRDTNLYNIEMPYPTPLGLGLAMALPKARVVVLDGDGSLISGIGVLTTIAKERPKNLTVLVWDNEAYVSTGGMPSPSAFADIAGIARASGVEKSSTVRNVEELRTALRSAFDEGGPSVIVAKVRPETRKALSNIPYNLTEGAIRFRRALVDQGYIDPLSAGVSWSMTFDHQVK